MVGGGGSFKKEAEELRDEVEVYNYEEEGVRKHGKKKQNKKQIKSRDDNEGTGSLFSDMIVGKLPKFANRITLKVMHWLKYCSCRLVVFEMVDKVSCVSI